MKSLLTLILFTWLTCTGAAAQSITDQKLFSRSEEKGYVPWDEGRRRPTGAGSGHRGEVTIRYNSTAASALGPDGNLKPGTRFPEGSVIVKEVYSAGNLKAIAVMEKAARDPNAVQGWVWGEYFPRPVAPGNPERLGVAKKGQICVGCHSIAPGRSPIPGDRGPQDFVRAFGLPKTQAVTPAAAIQKIVTPFTQTNPRTNDAM